MIRVLHHMEMNIAVVGLGYVGLPLAMAFSQHFSVLGYDHNQSRVNQLSNGVDITGEVDATLLRNTNLRFSTNPDHLKEARFFVMALPTPINHAKQPDLSLLFDATKTVGKYIKNGDIVVYESTVYPGATEEECVPILEKESGLKCGYDFFVGYSPERVSPGDGSRKLADIVKIIKAQDEATLKKIQFIYEKIITAGLYLAPNIKTAESAKLLENVQRDLNVALLNEVAMIFNRMKINTHAVLKAANTKWNFLPFVPGLVGGHCIGVDPYYLTYKAQCHGYHPQVILAGRRVNDGLGKYIADQTVRELAKNCANIKASTIILFGIAFKNDCPDIRNSRVKDVYQELLEFGANVYVHDPVANAEEVKEKFQIQLAQTDELPKADAVIIAVAHRQYREYDLRRSESQMRLKKRAQIVRFIRHFLDAEHFKALGHTVWAL